MGIRDIILKSLLLDLFIMFDFYNVSRGLFNVYTGLFFLLFYLSACVVMIITHKTYNGISISITCVLLWISVYADLYADIYRMISLPALILSFIPKFSEIISTMPAAIIGGVSFMLYGMISAIGVRNIVENKVDLSKSRNLIIAAVN